MLLSFRRLLLSKHIPSILRSPLVQPDIPEQLQYVGAHKRRPTLLYGWGFTGTGAFGCKNQDRITAAIPVRLRHQALKNPLFVSCGTGFTAVVTNQHRIYLLGLNHNFVKTEERAFYAPKQLLLPIDASWGKKISVTGLSAGRAHLLLACVDTVSGVNKLFAFGDNSHGQCYTGEITICGEETSPLVTCGNDTSFVLYPQSGRLYSFGLNDDCQLGYCGVSKGPCLVTGDLEGQKIVKVATKSNFAMALDVNGHVYFWGCREYSGGIIREERAYVPKRVHDIPPMKDIAVTCDCCIALTTDNELLTWGNCEPSFRKISIPPEIADIKHLSSGFHCAALIDSNFQCYVWGKDVRGTLAPTAMFGRARKKYRPSELKVPTRLSLPVDRILSIQFGLDHAVSVCQPIL